MAENSKIEWTDHTFNPWRGCVEAELPDGSQHPACDHCYAKAMAKRNPKALGVWGKDGTRVVASEAMWRQPLKWDKLAKERGERQRVFCASMADVFEDWQGPMHDHRGEKLEEDGYAYPRNPLTMNHVRRRLFKLIDATPNLDWLLLTKRPENVRRMWPQRSDLGAANFPERVNLHTDYRPNVWLGTSISDQATADQFVPELLKCRDLTPVLFLSVEPLLGPIQLAPHMTESGVKLCQGIDCDWVIVGGESGHHARPTHPEWARSLRDQCQAAGVPFFFKQWGEHAPIDQLGIAADSDSLKWGKWSGVSDRTKPIRVGKKAAGRLLDGREHSEFPNQPTTL